MSHLRARSGGTKVFLVSGVTEDVRRDLARKINQLGGKYFDLQYFKAICTHVICGKLSKSEKFLGGCACGKWVLHPDYVYQSVVAGAWLDEEQFEWCDEHILRRCSGVVPELYYASRRWRFMLGEEGRGAFQGWKVAVVAGAKKSQVIKRLLISGGAEVLNLQLPVKNANKVANTLGYIFVSEQNVGMVGHLFDYGVLCIRPEFIADYLLLDPQPDPMDYLVQNAPPADPLGSQESAAGSQGVGEGSQDSFLQASQTSQPSELNICNSPATPTHSASPGVSPRVVVVKEEPGPSRRRPSRSATAGNRPATPTSQLFPRARDRQQDDVIEIDITPQDTGRGRATATTSTIGNLDGLVIDLLSDGETPDRVAAPVLPATPTSSQVEAPGGRRASRTCTSHSPAWKQLIPWSRPKPAETPTCHNTELQHSSSPSDDIVHKDVASHIRNKARSSVSAASSPHSSSQQKQNGVATDLEKENVQKSQERVTSTPAKSVGSSKSSRTGVPLCMSPITFYFKPKVNTTETADAPKITSDAGPTLQAKKAVIQAEQASTMLSTKANSSSIGNNNAVEHSQPEVPLATEMKTNEKGVWESVELTKKTQNLCKPGGDKKTVIVAMAAARSTRSRRTITASETASTLLTPAGSDMSVARGEKMEVDSEPVQPAVIGAALLTPAGAASCSRKRKSCDEPSLHVNLQEQKRQKISTSEWHPTKYSLIFQDEKADHWPMRSVTTDIIMTTFEEEEEFILVALQELNSRVDHVYFPPAEILARLIHKVLPGARTAVEADLCHQVLMNVLRLHPPVTVQLQHMYLAALAGGREERGVAEEWYTLHTCCRMLLTEERPDVRRNYTLLLNFLHEMMQLNLQHFMLTPAVNVGSRHMLLRILWSPSYHLVFNNRCRELLDLMTDTLSLYETLSTEDGRSGLLDVLQCVVWLVAMAAECCRLEEAGGRGCPGMRHLEQEKVAAFVHEITRRIIDARLQDAGVLQCVLTSLQLPWLCAGVCQQLLNTLDDYLLADEAHRDSTTLTLALIVSRYFFLLPRMCSKPESQEKASPALKQRQERRHSAPAKKCLTESSNLSREERHMMSQVNKKNAKGETPLHRACITGNITKLRQLLQLPGIDVNAKDNFGWSPLHEACNHGNVECVRELLKFVPSRSVVQYFNKGHKVSKVDLFACNAEGITPLHDAVLNDQHEVCRLLLQHAGPRLLAPVTSLDYTPLDLACSEEMRALLAAFVPLQRRVSLEDSVLGSQDSCSSVDGFRTEPPSESLYEEVLEVEGCRVFADTQALMSYIHLTTTLVYSYITAGRLDNIKLRSTKHRKTHSEQNLVSEQNGVQLKPSLSGKSNTSVSHLAGQSICDRDNVFQRTSCEKENIPSPSRRCIDSHGNTDTIKPRSSTNVHSNKQRHTETVYHHSAKPRPDSPLRLTEPHDCLSSLDLPQSPLRLPECLDHVPSKDCPSSPLWPAECVEYLDREERTALKKDLRVARRLAKYRDMFRQHLYRLCRHGDRDLVEDGLLELDCLVEHLQQQQQG